MIRTLSYAAVFTSVLSLSAMAEDLKTRIYPGTGPTEIMNDLTPQMRGTASIALSEQEAGKFMHKPVYSSDGKLIGELVSFQRDADNKIVGMKAEVGSLGGLGSYRVELPASQFRLHGDRVLVNISAAVVKEFPQVQR